MQRMGTVIGVRPEKLEEYKRLHADVWPDVLSRIAKSNIKNFSIYLRQPENLLFAYWEYHGDDYAADSAAIAADPRTQEWWKLTDPCQKPFDSCEEGENWTTMEEVFHVD
ncbi:MAG: L-rhamnose mutarotase [Rhizobiales bacterium]|nr:L-rhamnose mutarotase [Hyphomicrobiales bacterium]NRB13646.1 L-rhamnose mutarotase [Hyphomicrobiales bacterium]